MALSRPSIEVLVDLVEIKLSCMDVWDQEVRRERALLQRCLRELNARAAAQRPAATPAAQAAAA